MVRTTMWRSDRVGRAVGFGLTSLLVSAVLTILPHSPLIGPAAADGGDFRIDFAAAAPQTYEHSTGGGAFNDGTIGRSADIVKSLGRGELVCGDIVTFLKPAAGG